MAKGNALPLPAGIPVNGRYNRATKTFSTTIPFEGTIEQYDQVLALCGGGGGTTTAPRLKGTRKPLSAARRKQMSINALARAAAAKATTAPAANPATAPSPRKRAPRTMGAGGGTT